MDWLTTSLLDLLHELRSSDTPIMVGGGFGLYLKRMHLQSTGERTLFEQLPQPRSTNDLDLFLRAEMLTDWARTSEVATAIQRLGYEPRDEARFMQWIRRVTIGGVEQEIKIDLLVGPIDDRHRPKLKIAAPRVRPKGPRLDFHAHLVREAIRLEEEPVEIAVAGQRSTGDPYHTTVQIPQAFPYLMMKLHAFHDRKGDSDKDLGRHHAMDLYSIAGMMVEAEYDRAVRLGRECSDTPEASRARQIIAADFSTDSGLGVLRIREHPLYREDFEISRFLGALTELFAFK